MQSKGKILIIDDEHAIRFIMAEAVAAKGYEVKTAASCEDALQLIGEECFQLVITDLIMPGRDGIETILALRAKLPRLRIIAMSGALNTGSRNFLPLAGKLGACSTLSKPFTRAALFEAIEGEIGKPSLLPA